MIRFKEWNKRDKILAAVSVGVSAILITVISIYLFDPYYSVCTGGNYPVSYDSPYGHVDGTTYIINCNTRAELVQHSISDQIHKIIPYAVAQTTNSASNMTQYKDSFGRFSVSYPNNWTATPATNRFETDVLTIHNDNPRTAFIVVQIQMVNNLPLDEFATAYRSGLYDWTVFQDTECTNYKIQGNTACSFIITRAEDTLTGTPSLTSLIVMTAAGGKAYIINLGSPSDNFDSMLPTYNKIIDSFHIGGSAIH